MQFKIPTTINDAMSPSSSIRIATWNINSVRLRMGIVGRLTREQKIEILREWYYDDRNITLKQGEEMGRFLLGSTVVTLFPTAALRFNPAWAPARPIRLGEAMAGYAVG